MTIDERLDVIEHLAEIGIDCKTNLLDIKMHIDEIRKELSKPILIWGEPLRERDLFKESLEDNYKPRGEDA